MRGRIFYKKLDILSTKWPLKTILLINYAAKSKDLKGKLTTSQREVYS